MSMSNFKNENTKIIFIIRDAEPPNYLVRFLDKILIPFQKGIFNNIWKIVSFIKFIFEKKKSYKL